MAEAETELAVISKTYDLLLWTAKHAVKFPRSYRFTAGDRLERNLYQVLENLLRAKYTRARLPLLRDANLDLEVLRFQFRLAKDLGVLSVKSYGYAAQGVNEIGKMVGGWIRHSGGSAPDETPRQPLA